MASNFEDAEAARKRKREPSAAPSISDMPSGASTPALVSRSGQAPETLSLSVTSPLDPKSLPTTRQSKPPTFTAAPAPSKLFLTPEVPINRATFRYTPAGAAEPGNLVLHRSIENWPPGVRFSWEDRSPHIRISQDGLTVEGFGGFRSSRINVPVREGKWYTELIIERSEQATATTQPKSGDVAAANTLGKHVRLGWARREASLNGPVGLDGYSYGMRDLTGECVTLSRLKQYGVPVKQGDVVGMYISLPPKRKVDADADDPYDPARMVRKRIPIGLKLQPYFESAEYKVSREMKALMDEEKPSAPVETGAGSGKKRKVEARPAKGSTSTDQGPVRHLPILEGSKIAYFVNGKCQGVAFDDIYDYLQLRETPKRNKAAATRHAQFHLKERNNPFDDGTLGYYPMVSLYHDAMVRINPGPDFRFPPPPDIDQLLNDDGADQPQEGLPQTWKPLTERYPEFMEEIYAMDEMEEEQARAKAAAAAAAAALRQLEGPSATELAEEEKARKKKQRDEAAKKKGKKDVSGGGSAHARASSLSVGGSVRGTSKSPQPGTGPGTTPPLPASSVEATPPPSSQSQSMKMEID